ncbi:MAG: DUF4350 domain-containing protein [bacterium]|nr:DUF4350 domain-containing protein [bacterium]MCP4966908.1 DUF4350 domain-containing protein [bacterium]
MSDQPIFRTRTGLVVIVAAGLLLVVGLFQSATEPSPTEGPAGSTYSTTPDGAAAFAALLEQNGYDVAHWRIPLATRPPESSDVIVVVNGNLLDLDDSATLRSHLESGGRVVAIGNTWLAGILDSPPNSTATTDEVSGALLPFGSFADIEQANGPTVWAEPGSMLGVVGNQSGILAAVQSVGQGQLVAIADASVISNAGLSEVDNALLGVQAVGAPGPTVKFIEYLHGFEQPAGLAALPRRWKQALLVLAFAGLIWLLSHARRLGPPQQTERALPPPRAAYVDAVAATLAAGKSDKAIVPLQERIEIELARRGADLGSATDVIDVAIRSGVDPEVARTALGESGHDPLAKVKLLSQIVSKEQL